MEAFLPETVFGVPLHPLVVHAVVVLVPLACLGLLALVALPRWRATYGPLLILVTLAAVGAVPLATASGENLKEAVNAGGEVAARIDEHADFGEGVLWFVLPQLVLTALLVFADRRGRTGAAVTFVAIAAAVSALLSLGMVVLTGHTGAVAVWNPTGS